MLVIIDGVGGAPRFNHIQILNYGVCKWTDGYWRACQSEYPWPGIIHLPNLLKVGQTRHRLCGLLFGLAEEFPCDLAKIWRTQTKPRCDFWCFNGTNQFVLSSQFSTSRELNYLVAREAEDGHNYSSSVIYRVSCEQKAIFIYRDSSPLVIDSMEKV